MVAGVAPEAVVAGAAPEAAKSNAARTELSCLPRNSHDPEGIA
jgi:hypothetical protein